MFVEAGTTSDWRVSPHSEDAKGTNGCRFATVDESERLLRRLAVNDEEAVGRVLSTGADWSAGATLIPKVDLLVRLGSLLALGATVTSLRAVVQRASAAGATEAELVAVLVAIAPAIGLARVVAAAPKLALAIGYDLEADGWGHPDPISPDWDDGAASVGA